MLSIALHSILFEDVHHLNKSFKILLNDWNYKIINRPIRKAQTVIMNTTECFTQLSTDNENALALSDNVTRVSHMNQFYKMKHLLLS